MRFGRLGMVAVGAAVLGSALSLAASMSVASAQPVPIDETIGTPPGWADYDANGDGGIDMEECQGLSDDELASFHQWLEQKLDEHDDGAIRDWAAQRLPPSIVGPGCPLGSVIPDPGLIDQVGDIPGEIADAAGDLAGLPGDMIGGAARRGFDAVADSFAEGANTLIVEVTTSWTRVPSTSGTQEDVSESLMVDLEPVTALLATIALIVAMVRMAFASRGDALREIFAGLLRVLVVGSAGIAFVTMLLEAGDVFSEWMIERSTGGGLQTGRLALLSTAGASSGLIFTLSLLAIITAVIQIAMLMIRSAMVVVLLGAWQLSAAGAALGDGTMFKKITGWLLAFILYKPAAAVVYAAGFRLMGMGEGSASPDLLAMIQGVLLLVLAILVLPAMIRLVAPAAAMGGPSAAGAIAGGAAVAGGAVMLAGTGGAASGLIGASGGGGQASGPSGSAAGAAGGSGPSPSGSSGPSGGRSGAAAEADGGADGAPSGGAGGSKGAGAAGGPTPAGQPASGSAPAASTGAAGVGDAGASSGSTGAGTSGGGAQAATGAAAAGARAVERSGNSLSDAGADE